MSVIPHPSSPSLPSLPFFPLAPFISSIEIMGFNLSELSFFQNIILSWRTNSTEAPSLPSNPKPSAPSCPSIPSRPAIESPGAPCTGPALKVFPSNIVNTRFPSCTFASFKLLKILFITTWLGLFSTTLMRPSSVLSLFTISKETLSCLFI